ncbi:hypothetical protein ABK040_015450 [Willaertia magna]
MIGNSITTTLKQKQQVNLRQLPIETFQIIVTFLIGNLDLNLNEIIEQYFKNFNYNCKLPSLQNVLTLLSFTNINKELLQKSDWIITFYKNCCKTLDFINYINLNEGKRYEKVGQGDLTAEEKTEINDIHNLILFSELGIIDTNKQSNDKKDRFCKDWYNLQNAKKYFTKRMELLTRENNLKEENNYFLLFLTKILNLIAPMVDTQNDYQSYSKCNDTINNVTTYYGNDYNYSYLDWCDGSVLGLILDVEANEILKEGIRKKYLKLKKSLQNLFYLSFNYDFYYWDCFRKDKTVFNSILFLHITLNTQSDLTDIVFNNVRYLLISNNYENQCLGYYENSEVHKELLFKLLQQKHFPKLNHLVLEGQYFTLDLKQCDILQNLEKLTVRCMDSDDFRNGNDIFNTLKNLLPYCPNLKFCIIPQYLLVQFYDSVRFEGVKDIYNLDDKNCVISIQNNSYNYYYDRCME